MSSTSTISGRSPLLTLNNGVEMPALGLGVYQSEPRDTGQAVETALREGYRLIDTAAAYFNEREVGEAVARSGIERRELFITTKLWMSDYGYDRTLRAFDISVRKLGLEYLDLYLLHWPVPSAFETTVPSYRAAEKLLADGRVLAIGVSNFSAPHLEDLIARTSVVPAVNQVELHPFFTQRELRDTHARFGIATQSWSPLGGVKVYAAADPKAAKHHARRVRALGPTDGRARARKSRRRRRTARRPMWPQALLELTRRHALNETRSTAAKSGLRIHRDYFEGIHWERCVSSALLRTGSP